MKKITLTLVLVVAIFVMTSCSGEYEFNYKTEDWDNVKIEIVEIDGYVDSTYHTSTSYEESYNDQKIVVIAEIDDKATFISELQSLKSYQPFGTPIGEINGKAIRLIYPDGQIELITQYGSALISEAEVRVYTKTFDDEQFDEFWEKWSNEA